MARRPRKLPIGIAATSPAWAAACDGMVHRAGSDSRILQASELSLQGTLATLGGLIVGGDYDLDQELTRAGWQPDALLLAAVKAALDRDMPILCIGQGLEALNVAVGGRPANDATGHSYSLDKGEVVPAYHRIYITPGSRLAATVGSGGFVRVNSCHPRGIREPQKSSLLLASAYSLEDGIIEGLESPDHAWVIAVQFHPERRMEVPPHFDRLFEALALRATDDRKARHRPGPALPASRN